MVPIYLGKKTLIQLGLMDYSDIQISIKNIPRLERLADNKCCRKYLYRFADLLPIDLTMSILAKQLNQKFTLFKQVYQLPEDVDICMWVSSERIKDREAIFSVSTTEPEECFSIIYATNDLPVKIENIFGTVASIQGQPSEIWIKRA
jgi:hypothetical protein